MPESVSQRLQCRSMGCKGQVVFIASRATRVEWLITAELTCNACLRISRTFCELRMRNRKSTSSMKLR